MLTKTRNKGADLDPFREPTAEEIDEQARQDKVSAAIERRAKEIKREQSALAPSAQLSADDRWAQAKREVQSAIKKNRRAERARRLRADVDSAYTRNKHLVDPWKAGAAYAASGEVGAVLAEAVSLGAGAGVAAAGATAASWLGWRHIKSLPEKYWTRMRGGLAAGCATCLSLPVLPWDWHAAALAGGTAALIAASAKRWRDREPPYPPAGGYGVTDHQAAVEQVAAAVDADDSLPAGAADIIADWNTYVAGNILPGAELVSPVAFEYGWIFTVRLVRGKQKLETLQRATSDIAYALNVPESDITIDPGTSNMLEPTLTITTSKPDTTYTGPVVVWEGSEAYIEIGPYVDGKGTVRHHALSGQLNADELAAGLIPGGSVIGGFVLGDKGSGKSRFLEALALGLRKLGIEVWWMDPFGSTSSPLLSQHAEWPLSGVDSADGRVFGNVEDLLEAMEGVCQVRSDEHSVWGWSGFQHTRERPAIVVMIDECHEVFDKYADRFADIDRMSRKLGMGIIGASQDPTQKTFGSEGVLRRGMCGTNAYALKYGGSNAGLAFSSYDGQPLGKIPERRGYGYSPNSDRPHTMFQNRYAENLAPFFANLAPATLDRRATVGAGDAYANRHKAVADTRAAAQARLDDYDTGKLKPTQKKANPKSASTTQPASSDGSVSYMFPGTQSTPENPQVTRESLTARQLQILNMLTTDHLNAKDLATELGKTARTISSDLKFLREHKFARVVDEQEGKYTASDNV